MSNNLYDRLAKNDEYLQNRKTLSEQILRELRKKYDYPNDFDYEPIISYTIKTDSSETIEEKQKIKIK